MAIRKLTNCSVSYLKRTLIKEHNLSSQRVPVRQTCATRSLANSFTSQIIHQA